MTGPYHTKHQLGKHSYKFSTEAMNEGMRGIVDTARVRIHNHLASAALNKRNVIPFYEHSY
jgi:hypothetical protein